MDNINYYVSLDLGSDSMVAAFYDPNDFESSTRLIPLQERAVDYVRAPGSDADLSVKPLLEREGNAVSCRLKTRISLTDDRQPQTIEADHAALDAVADAAAGRGGGQPQSIFRFFHVTGGVILQNKLMPNPKIPFQLGAREVFPRVRARGGGSVTLAPDVLLKHLTSQVLRSFVLPAAMLGHIENPAQSVCLLLTVPNVYSVTHKQALREFLEAQNIVARVKVVCESDAVAYSIFSEMAGASPEFAAFKTSLHRRFEKGKQRLLTIDVGRGTTDLSLIEWENAGERGSKRRHLTLARAGISEGGNTLSHILARYYQGRIRAVLAAQGYALPFDLLGNRPADNAAERAKALSVLERLIEVVKRGFNADLTNDTPLEVQGSWLKSLARTLVNNVDLSKAKAPSTHNESKQARADRHRRLRARLAKLREEQENPATQRARGDEKIAELTDTLRRDELEASLPQQRAQLARLRQGQTGENTLEQRVLNDEIATLSAQVRADGEGLQEITIRQRQRELGELLQSELLLPRPAPPDVDDDATKTESWWKRTSKVVLYGGAREARELAVDGARAVASGVKSEIERAKSEREQAALLSTMSDFTREIETWEELLQEIRAHVRRSVVDLINETFRLASADKVSRDGFFEAPSDCWVLVAGQASQFAPLKQEIEQTLTKRRIPADRRLFLTGPLAKHACCLGAIEYEHSGTEIVDKGFFGTLAIATPLTAVGPGESALHILDERAFSEEGATVEFHHAARRRLIFFPSAPPVGQKTLDISEGAPVAQTLGDSIRVHVCYDAQKSQILFDGKPVAVPTYANTPHYIWSQVWPDMLPPRADEVATDEADEDDSWHEPDFALAAPADEADEWLAEPDVTRSTQLDRAPLALALPPSSALPDDDWDEVDNALWEVPEIPLPPARGSDGKRESGGKR